MALLLSTLSIRASHQTSKTNGLAHFNKNYKMDVSEQPSMLTKNLNITTFVGDTVTFALTLSNAGPNTATGVAVSDALPTGGRP